MIFINLGSSHQARVGSCLQFSKFGFNDLFNVLKKNKKNPIMIVGSALVTTEQAGVWAATWYQLDCLIITAQAANDVTRAICKCVYPGYKWRCYVKFGPYLLNKQYIHKRKAIWYTLYDVRYLAKNIMRGTASTPGIENKTT